MIPLRAACGRIGGWIIKGQLGGHLRAWARLRWQAYWLRRSGAFDAAWYRAAYPDVAASGVDPALHYLRRGAAEGRAPLPVPDPPRPSVKLTDSGYQAWIADRERLSAAEREAIRASVGRMRWQPEIGVVVLGGDIVAIRATRASIAAQIYPVWRLADRPCGDATLFVPAGTIVAPMALFEVAAAIVAAPEAELIYADQDRIDAEGARTAPWFKPDWDPILAAESDLLGVSGVFRDGLLARLGVVSVATEAALRALAHRVARAVPASAVRHIPSVLFHVPVETVARIVEPLVSVIVPTRDRAALLARCVQSVLERTDYAAIELIIVDNDSRQGRTRRLLRRLAEDRRVRVLPFPGRFNWSAMNNVAVRVARGAFVVLLNNDIEAIHPGWLRAMVDLARRPEIGVVGARLLFPDGTVQHAGITLGPGAVGGHVLRGVARDDPGPGGMLRHTRSVAAVTGACMAVRRAVFDAVGGFESTQLAVTNNDVDFCLRVRALGWRVVCTPRAELYHREAASRGMDASPARLARVLRERAYLLRTWGRLAEHDPYLNPNLTMVGEEIALAASPGQAIARERRRDTLDVGQQIGRQVSRRERGAADIERVGQAAEPFLDRRGDGLVGADGGEQGDHVVGDFGGHLRPLAGLRHGVELAPEIAEPV
jgi:GT2 family glycosyltransferase